MRAPIPTEIGIGSILYCLYKFKDPVSRIVDGNKDVTLPVLAGHLGQVFDADLYIPRSIYQRRGKRRLFRNRPVPCQQVVVRLSASCWS